MALCDSSQLFLARAKEQMHTETPSSQYNTALLGVRSNELDGDPKDSTSSGFFTVPKKNGYMTAILDLRWLN